MVIDHLLALKGISPFSRLRDSELVLIANVVREVVYPPGAKVFGTGRPLPALHIVIDGRVQGPDGVALPAVFGVESLLLDQPAVGPLAADPCHGARCLLISRAHFFTMVNECPALTVGFIEDFIGPGAAGVMREAP